VGALAAIAGAAVMGLVVGATVTTGVQDVGSRRAPATAPTSRPAATPTTLAAVVPSPAVLLAWTPNGLDPGLASAATGDPAVTATSVVRSEPVDLVRSRDAHGTAVDDLADGWAIALDAVAVDPAAHAAFASLADQAAVADLGDGDALLGATSARLRRLGPGSVLELAGGQTVAVTGVVGDTAIGGAELAVDLATGARLGIDTERFLLAAYDGDRRGLEARLRAALASGVAVRFRGPGETPFLRHGDAVLPQAHIKDRFGEFAHRRGPGDEVEQDSRWQTENLVTVDLPIVGRTRCHRLVVDALAGALAEVVAANLGGLVDPDGFAGCWNPRTTRGGTSLSRHAWGVAADINAGDNPTGLTSVQDARLIAIFARWGFTEGSTWLVPDAGHFEYVSAPGG
jgi:hypothetical protein